VPDPTRRFVDVSAATFARLLGFVVLVALWLSLWQWVLLLVVAIYLAVALDPAVTWLAARRIRRGMTAPLLAVTIAGAVIGFGYFAGASLVEQGRLLGERVQEMQDTIVERVPAPLLDVLPSVGEASSRFGAYFLTLGRAAASGVLSIAVALVLTVYLLLDGRRTYDWIVAFAPRARRPRVQRTAEATRRAIVAYVRGNVATSVLTALVTFVVLWALGVPAALLLSLLAGVFDFVPVLGILLSLVPAALLAATVSPAVLIAVTAFYLLYNAVENYYIAPKVYGHELRLSDLAVIGAFAVGAELGGVVGALVALPLAAIYPAVEQEWLADRLGRDVVEDHRRIEQTEER
jgi:predicted PurR-regulated permease PerM